MTDKFAVVCKSCGGYGLLKTSWKGVDMTKTITCLKCGEVEYI